MTTTLWRHARLVTFADARGWGLIERGALLVDGATIAWAGADADLPAALRADAEIDLDLPGEETLHLQVKVVRVEDDARTGVALKFAGDSSTARMPLANFIMKSHQAR